jgi:hypothetical protein
MSDPIRYGTDSSGRPIWMSPYMHQWWLGVVRALGWEPVIVQGAWMSLNGGGAAASAGYHDKGGCLDIRSRDLPEEEIARVIRVTRHGGAASWARDKPASRGGMDPHIHLVLGSDADLANGAAAQWRDYLAGRNGLASGGLDYHPRPNPVVLRPTTTFMEDPVTPEDIDKIADRAVEKLLAKKITVGKTGSKRDIAVRQLLRELWNNRRA